MGKSKLNSRATNIINDLRSSEKITVVSRDTSNKINREIAVVVEKAKKEFEFRERNSRAAVAQIELSTFNK